MIVVASARHHRRRATRHFRLRAHAPVMLTAGGIAILGIGAILGFEGANLIHRRVMTKDATAQGAAADTETFNASAVLARPNGASIGWQLGLGVVGIAGGVFLPWKWLKLLSYGIGLGAIGHLAGQAIDAWIVRPLFKDKKTNQPSAMGKRLFAPEYAADAVVYPAQPASGTTQGPPGTMGAPVLSKRGTPVIAAALPAAMAGRTPPALASLGAAPNASLASMFGGLGQRTEGGNPPPPPPSRGQVPQPVPVPEPPPRQVPPTNGNCECPPAGPPMGCPPMMGEPPVPEVRAEVVVDRAHPMFQSMLRGRRLTRAA